MGWLRRSSLIGFFIAGIAAIVCAVSAAHAQCAATDKIYIDPRLVPKPLNCSRDMMGAGAWLNAPQGQPPIQLYRKWLRRCTQQAQGRPIRIPYGTGKVLVHPTNPCIQQYIP